jgi:hypothetical protein
LSFARSADGRAVYVAFKQQYLGEAFQSRIHAAADKTLDGTFLMANQGHPHLKDIAKD